MDTLGTLSEHETVRIEFFGVKKADVFGFFQKEEERRDSDVEILVEFRASQKMFGNYMELKVLS